jgi:hypothetical protein
MASSPENKSIPITINPSLCSLHHSSNSHKHHNHQPFTNHNHNKNQATQRSLPSPRQKFPPAVSIITTTNPCLPRAQLLSPSITALPPKHYNKTAPPCQIP